MNDETQNTGSPHNSTMLAHARREFARLPIPENELDQQYTASLQAQVLEVIGVIARQGHSGGTFEDFFSLLTRCARRQPLSPLSDDPAEWMDMASTMLGANSMEVMRWQNIRDSSAFSGDGGKNYWTLYDSTKGQRPPVTRASVHVEPTGPHPVYGQPINTQAWLDEVKPEPKEVRPTKATCTLEYYGTRPDMPHPRSGRLMLKNPMTLAGYRFDYVKLTGLLQVDDWTLQSLEHWMHHIGGTLQVGSDDHSKGQVEVKTYTKNAAPGTVQIIGTFYGRGDCELLLSLLRPHNINAPENTTEWANPNLVVDK